jgi:tetratricopeptide (TPR) repeat protein
VIDTLAAGKTDKQAVEAAVHKPFAAWEKSWLAHVRKQPFPRELIPLDPDERKELKGEATAKKDEKKKPKEISFGDFAEVSEVEARKFAHLGELMREKNRTAAAAEEYGKAQNLVGNKYESVSNKYALALLELQRLDDAERVLLGSLTMHPGSAATNVHLGRIYLKRQDWQKALGAYTNALAEDPFDEEIHVALFRVHEKLGEKDLMERERKATMTLTGVPAEAVPQLAKVVEGANLADVQLPQAAEKPAASRVDAGSDDEKIKAIKKAYDDADRPKTR